MAAYKTGEDVDASCNKCKLVLAHVIIAMDGAKIMRVECKTCRNLHAYKKQPATKSAAKTPRARATSKAVGPSDYEKIIKGHDLSRAQRYQGSVAYSEGDVVDHVTFGLGIIMRVLGDAKIEVIFPKGMKILIHARGAVA